MKYVLILSILALLALASCSTSPTAPENGVSDTSVGADIPAGFSGSKTIDTTLSSFEFEGYAIAKSHVGTFDDWSGSIVFENGQIVGALGTIQAASVNTGIEPLDNHLRSDDFFDVETYSTIQITSTNIAQGMVTADLTFRGITKSISFPATITKNSISADFLLDMGDFAMHYVGVKSDVRIVFTMVV